MSKNGKLGKFIVKFHKIILLIAAILMIPSLIGMLTTRVNYDMLTYLPDSMETVIGQDELIENFGKGAFTMIITDKISDSEIGQVSDKLKDIDHVETVLSLGSFENMNFPAAILPDDIYDTFRHGDLSIIAVFFDTSTSSDETLNAIGEIRSVLNGRGYVSGMSAFATDLRNIAEEQELIYVVIAVALALLVMLLFIENWLAPFLFLISIGVMILINMGTNFMFGEISYITKALSAILQLAVTMDYSIFLWHSFREYLEDGDEPDQAMERAVNATLSSVLGSSATTIAGFLALCFMTFTLGLDLGLVMAKGVLLGVLGSVTVLPALIMICHKFIKKLDHKALMPKFNKLSSGIVKAFPVFIILFAVIIPPAFYGYQQTQANVYYELGQSLPDDMESAIANKLLKDDFGLSNVHMVLTSSKLSEKDARAMTRALEDVDGVKSVLNLEAIVPENTPLEILPDSLVEILKSDKWELTLIISEYNTASDEIALQIAAINDIIKGYDSTSLLVGEASSTQDMIDLTAVDFQVVNAISIVAIFVIIAIVTKSLSLPFILIAVIESAIFVNLGLPYYFGDQLSFITPICISTIQLGATVDYAILMTTRYKRERLEGKDKKQAAKIAISTSAPSIVVSGLGLFAATFGVAVYSTIDMISSMCMLMARGAVISMVAVTFILPSLLILADPLVIRTTLGMKKLTIKRDK